MADWKVDAKYHAEAQVWYVVDGDVPGLFADAETLEALKRKIGPMILDLLEINADLVVDKARLASPHHVRIIAQHEHAFDIAA